MDCLICGKKVWVFDEEDMVLGWAIDYCECDEGE
jgi:hypothetical protein